ncbi:MFS transporter, SP family, general alpha glucoside:H+ symporter [Cryptococcus neoformans c45]|nr:MFS transporter, SP family, general alpha glucoside:H+ symporter [Cryptococcus neoformans var. grubii c45]
MALSTCTSASHAATSWALLRVGTLCITSVEGPFTSHESPCW